MPSEIRIYPDARFVRWQRNFDKLGTKPMSREAIEEWEIATEVMFDLTQQYAHVLSGDMKGSGEMEIASSTPTSITAHITYGGGQRSNVKPHWKHQTIDYTQYELQRGESHDFFSRAHQRAQDRLEKGSLNAMMAQMNTERW